MSAPADPLEANEIYRQLVEATERNRLLHITIEKLRRDLDKADNEIGLLNDEAIRMGL